jgi:hypothetical protein
MRRIGLTLVLALFATVPHLNASGPLGIYGIVEKVVFEPNEAAAERIQIWGAFAYCDATGYPNLTISTVGRGYLYFRLPTAAETSSARHVEVIRNEWSDLKGVAGTGQAIGFGSWGYIGAFGGLRPDIRSPSPPYLIDASRPNQLPDMRVRPSSERPASPALYATNAGISKISAAGTHAAIVKQLQDALK